MAAFTFKSNQLQNIANIATLLSAVFFLIAAIVPFVGCDSDPG